MSLGLNHSIAWGYSLFMVTVTELLFSHLVMSNSLWPHGLQHASLPCPSLSPGVCSNSCQLSRWCHPTISSSVIEYLILSVYHYLSILTLGFWFFSHFFHFINSTVNILVVSSYIPIRITVKSHLSECSTLIPNHFTKGRWKSTLPLVMFEFLFINLLSKAC